MSYFENICLLKAPQAFETPYPHIIADLTEICYLAAMVEEDVDSISIPVDFYEPNAWRSFVEYLKKYPVDLVGISAMTGAYNNACRLAKIAKGFDKYVVMGGYHPTALPDDVLESPYVDAIIKGEGELTFKELVQNGPSKAVAGLAFKADGNIIHNDERPLIKHLDSIPHPARHLRPRRFGERGAEYTIDCIFSSRGCPWSCTFCANQLVHKGWRARSPENVIEELLQLHDPQKKKLIKIWDANFLTDVKRVEKICDLILEHDLTNFKICTETRIDDVLRAEGIMDRLYQIGFRHIGLGIESPNPQTLKLMKKKNATQTHARAVKILNRHRIKSQGYFIIGHYSETEEDTRRYPEFAASLNLWEAFFMVMTPYPGTEIFEEYRSESKIKSFDWDHYNNFGLVVETRGMDSTTLRKMYAYCWGKFYVPKAFQEKNSLLALIFQFFKCINLICFTLKMESSENVRDLNKYIFSFLEAGCVKLAKPTPEKVPLFLRWPKQATLRFRDTRGRGIDYHFRLNGDNIIFEGKPTENTDTAAAYTFHIEDILRLSESVQARRILSIACKHEIAKKKIKKGIRYYLHMLLDREVLFAVCVYFGLLIPVLTKGVLSAVFTGYQSADISQKNVS